MELMQASRQWAMRPADERFVSLTDMAAMMAGQRQISRAKVIPSKALTVIADHRQPDKCLLIEGQNGKPAAMTHWSFGQIAALADAPAGYLRKIDARLAADCINEGIKVRRSVEDVGVLVSRSPEADMGELRAATGPNYGRVWNVDVVEALMDRFGDGVSGDFKVPGEFGRAVTVTEANTTLYASDRDMFVFLADETNRLEVPNRRNGRSGSMARGFFVWNSEVGSATFGIAMFLFDYVCMNRIVWGARDYKEVRIRHTASAPDRFINEVAPTLIEYANSSAAPIEATLRAAQQRKIDDVDKWLASRFTKPEVVGMKAAHMAEEDRPIETIWDAVTGATAYAKSFKHQDARVDLERRAGKMLDLVEVK